MPKLYLIMESVYNQQNNISDVIANLQFPQKYVSLEYDGKLYNLDVVSVDSHEIVLRVIEDK